MALFGGGLNMGGWKPFQPSTWAPHISDPIQAFGTTDPGVGAINQSPAAQAFMQAALPIAGGVAFGPAGSAGGAYLGQRLFGEGTSGERQKRGVRAGVMAGGTHMAGQGIYDYYGGGGATPAGARPSAELQGGQPIRPSWETETLPPTYPESPSATGFGYRQDPFTGELQSPGGAMGSPGGAMIAPPGQAPGPTPYAYMGGPGAYTGSPGYPAYATNYPTTGGGGVDWGGIARRWGPLMALQGLSVWQQKEMAEDYQEAQKKSYEDYLKTINIPEDVKETRFQGLKKGILEAAPAARERRASAMAARGIRGKGAAAPIAETESDIQRAIDAARLSVYGQYNVPGAPPPVSYTPSTGQMALQQGTDLGTLLMMYNLYGGGR